MPAPDKPRRWRRLAKVALFGLIALASMPIVIVAMFGNAGGRRS